MKANKCVLCFNEVDEEYSYQEYLNEIHTGNTQKCYCTACKEILRSQRRREKFLNAITKVKIRKSDYHLPGFEWSDKHNCYIRSKRGK